MKLKEDKNFAYPDELIPTNDLTVKCKHGNSFDGGLIPLGAKVTVIHENRDEVLNTKNFARTSNSCKCRLQKDTHDLALWNLGNGRFLDYAFLLAVFHDFNEGMSLTSRVESRVRTIKGKGTGRTSVLTVKDLDRGYVGFCFNMELEREDFMCEECGPTPEYLILDGKQLGPGKKDVEHLEEFDRHPEDDHKLDQGSTFESRVFLNIKDDRTLLGKLADADNLVIGDFLDANLSSTNGELVKNLVSHIDTQYQDAEEKIPSCYRKLLSNLSKKTSVSGFLQPTCPESLDILDRFCKRQVNIRSFDLQEDLKLVMSEFPALWPSLEDILNLEDKLWLPHAVAEVIKKLIRIRKKIFLDAKDRFNDDYVPYNWNENGEHPTMFYPHWPAIRYPKQYKLGRIADDDLCTKVYRQSSKHPTGLFSGGCPHNITYGFEITLHRESQHNAFRLLECRNLDTSKLKGLINIH